MSCGACSEKTKANVAAATGAPQATGVISTGLAVAIATQHPPTSSQQNSAVSEEAIRPPRVYGRWVGNERGVKEDPDHCVQERFDDYIGRQCSRQRGFGRDGLYCKKHAKQHPATAPVESELPSPGAAAALGAPQATDVVQQFRTRWRRWLGNKTRRDMPTWTTLLDSNWMGWVERVNPDYIPLRLEDAGRESVKALWLAAIDAATMADLRRLDGLYAAEKARLL